jgi:hypothetical protein
LNCFDDSEFFSLHFSFLYFQNDHLSPFRGWGLEEFRMCCVLGGCDYFKLKGVALKTAMKVFVDSKCRQPERWLTELLPTMPRLVQVFSELLTLKKPSFNEGTAAQVVKGYLLADAAFQCPLVVNLPLAQPVRNKPLFFSLVAPENLPREQRELVLNQLEFVRGKMPNPAEQWRIATAGNPRGRKRNRSPSSQPV